MQHPQSDKLLMWDSPARHVTNAEETASLLEHKTGLKSRLRLVRLVSRAIAEEASVRIRLRTRSV